MSTSLNNLNYIFLSLQAFQLLSAFVSDADISFYMAKPGCSTKCGNLTIPYPFGIGIDCAFHDYFNIFCNHTYSPPKAYLNHTSSTVTDSSFTFRFPIGIEVIDITEKHVRVKSPMIAESCYVDKTGPYYTEASSRVVTLNFSLSPFTISTVNKLTVIGCDDQLFSSDNFATCTSSCSKVDEVRGGCSSYQGNGCCQTTVSAGMQQIDIHSIPYSGRPGVESFNPCSYSFLGEVTNFTFRGAVDFKDPTFERRTLDTTSIVLDWHIGDTKCREQLNSSTQSECPINSHCVDAEAGIEGYRCNCNNGFQGNPYISNIGCQDVDECISNPCSNICLNTEGDYLCSCLDGYFGDGKINGTGCSKNPSSQSKFSVVLKICTGFGVGALTLISTLTMLCVIINNRKLVRQREKFFRRNGGFLLKQRLSTLNEDAVVSTNIFTTNELKRATNNYKYDRILGQGGSGIVYKGVLQDKLVVAIKKSRFIDRIQIEEFINEVFILTQVNHRNVVKLVGCCLETELPLLVYEYVPKGTLSYHIEESKEEGWFSWDTRLRIAIEIASALSYLHSGFSTPIIHRDVKSTNILLDHCYVAKVSDFGASRLLSLDQTRVNTLVLGTLGYLDPEYFRTGDLTEKSDVYSFGVVLAELISGKKPLLEGERTLASLITESVGNLFLFQIVDLRVRREATFEQMEEFGNLIVQCLHQEGKERPTMREVVINLELIRGLTKNNLHVDQDYSARGVDSMKGQSDLYLPE